MVPNTKQTSVRIARLASSTLQNTESSQTAKSLAASALSQRNTSHQTGAVIEDLASTVLNSSKYSAETKKLAGSVVSQANKAR